MNKSDIKKIMSVITLFDIVIIVIFLKVLTINNVAISKKSSIDARSKESTVIGNYAGNQSTKNSQAIRSGEDYRGTTVDNVLNLYQQKIIGNWRVSKSMIFCFHEDGSYSGFFDNKRNNVNNYTYQCTVNSTGEPTLSIYNKEKSSMVVYVLKLNDNNNVVLHFDAANIDIELKKET